MKLKVLIGFIILFAVYHSSELFINPVFILFTFIAFFIVAHYVAKLLGEKGISVFGIKKHKYASRDLFIGYLIGLFFYGSSFIVSVISGKISFEGNFSLQQMVLPVAGIMLITFLSSASEDILTRGFLFKYLPKTFSVHAMVIISSVVYLLNHIWRIGDGYTQWILLFLMGLTYAIPFAASGSLWFTIGCHWGWNTVSLFKREIGSMSDLQIIDQTTDWIYIITMFFFLLVVILYSTFFLQKKKDKFSSYEHRM